MAEIQEGILYLDKGVNTWHKYQQQQTRLQGSLYENSMDRC